MIGVIRPKTFKINEKLDAVASRAFREATDAWREKYMQSLEAWVQAELRRLKTHRMNVVRITKGSRIERTGEWTFKYVEETWLELLLPRGPRPLP